jgi:Immunity protein 10
MSSDPDSDVDDLARRSSLPDPCTLLFGVPRAAPLPTDDAGREWSVAHWVHCARRAGHVATPAPSADDEHLPTYCGDIDLDGLTYQVHRGLRKRILVQYVSADGTMEARFELEESVWVEPVAPEPLPNDCPWCELGPPSTFRHAGESEAENVYVVGMSEHPGGEGRVITFQVDLEDSDEDDTYCVVLDPGQHTVYGGITECVIEDGTLRLSLSPEAADELGVEPHLRFHLTLDRDQLALVSAGLRRVLTAGRPDARPHLLRV